MEEWSPERQHPLDAQVSFETGGVDGHVVREHRRDRRVRSQRGHDVAAPGVVVHVALDGRPGPLEGRAQPAGPLLGRQGGGVGDFAHHRDRSRPRRPAPRPWAGPSRGQRRSGELTTAHGPLGLAAATAASPARPCACGLARLVQAGIVVVPAPGGGRAGRAGSGRGAPWDQSGVKMLRIAVFDARRFPSGQPVSTLPCLRSGAGSSGVLAAKRRPFASRPTTIAHERSLALVDDRVGLDGRRALRRLDDRPGAAGVDLALEHRRDPRARTACPAPVE